MRGLHDFELRLPPPALSLPPDPGPVSEARPHYWGHRERLRQRFLSGGHAAMPEYELLELLLFNAIPRSDVSLRQGAPRRLRRPQRRRRRLRAPPDAGAGATPGSGCSSASSRRSPTAWPAPK